MQSEIFKAIRKNDFIKVKELIENCEDVNLDNNGRTVLIFLCGIHTESKEFMIAYENEILKVIKLLIDKGANVNIEDRNGKTALFWACQNGYLDIVNLLIDKGANVNVRDTTLMEACKNNHCSLLDLIVDDDIIIEKVDYKTGTSPLMKACMNNHFEIAKLLTENGANVNAKK